MADKNKKQCKKTTISEKNQQNTINQGFNTDEVDIFCLAHLQDNLEQANKELINIFLQFSIDSKKLAEIYAPLGNEPKVWSLKQGQEFLDIIIANSALGKMQILENSGWLVQVNNLNFEETEGEEQ